MAPAAQAVTCQGFTAFTSFTPSSSQNFTKPTNTGCVDLNAAYTLTRDDSIRGWYHNSAGWQVGQRGFVKVTTCNCGWLILVSNVVNGTLMRGEGFRYSQNVRYVA